MGNTSSTIKIIFDGSARGIVTAAGEAKAALKAVDDENSKVAKAADKIGTSFLGATKGILALGTAANSLTVAAGAASSLATMSGILAEVPAVALAGAASLVTLKMATAGTGDAFKAALADDPAAYAKAVAKLSPAARDAAGAVRELQPRLHDLQQSVQDNFWTGWSTELTNLGNKALPKLSSGFEDVALQMGQAGVNVLKMAQGNAVLDDMDAILSGTADLWDGLKTAPADVLEGVLALGGAGSAELGNLGDAIGNAAAKFDAWAKSAAEAGKVTEWVQNAKDEFRTYGQVLQNVGDIGVTVFDGLSAGGLDFAGNLEKSTAALDAFLHTAEGQEALKELGQDLQVAGDVAREIFLAAIQELAPVIVELSPAFREVATAIGDNVVGAIHTVGPILQDLAGFLSANKDILGDLVPILLTAAAGYKGLQVANNVAGWVGSATTALGGFGKSADTAATKADGLKGKLGGLKAIGPALLITVAIIGIDEGIRKLDEMSAKIKEVPQPDRSGWDNFILTVDDAANSVFNAHDNIKNTNWNDFWDPNEAISSRFQATKRLIEGWHPTPIELGLNDQPARTALTGFMGEVNGQAPEININGRTEGAAQALADVVQAINRGEGSVKINGVDIPAQDALARIVHDINIAVGTVQVDGETKLAGDALADWIKAAQGGPGPKVPVNADTTKLPEQMRDGVNAALTLAGPAEIPVNADTIQAGTAIGALKQAAETPSTKPIDADVSGGLGAVDILRGAATTPETKPILGDNTQGLEVVDALNGAATTPQTKPILGDNGPGLGAVDILNGAATTPETKPLLGDNGQGMGAVGALDNAQTTPQTKPLNGDNSQGISQVDALDARGRAGVTKPITTHDENSGSVFASIAAKFAQPIIQVVHVISEVFSADGGAVGPIGLATGGTPPQYKGHVTGAIYGPGTGTSDTAGLYRLSNGEHVLTAAEVQALGGQAAVYRLRAMIRAGMLPGFATGGSPGVVGGDGASSPAVEVKVLIDGQEFRGMIDSRIRAADRATARTARVGAGVGWGS